MPIFFVSKKEWLEYMEHKGVVVIADHANQAKGIAIAEWGKGQTPKSDIVVEEIDSTKRGIICSTDWVRTK